MAQPIRRRSARLTATRASAMARASAVTSCTDNQRPRLPSTPTAAHDLAPSSDATSAMAAVAPANPIIDHATSPISAARGGSKPNPPANQP